LIIGVPKEVKPGERRVAVTPSAVARLVASGVVVKVERGAGAGSGFSDAEYAAAGAGVAQTAEEAWTADLVTKVKEPTPGEYRLLDSCGALFAFLHLAGNADLGEELLRRKVTALAFETVSEGGELPLLRPMSEVAGTMAVQAGMRGLEAINGGRGILLWPLGEAPPGTVAILGAGTAGRAAARTAARTGARTVVLEVDPARRERASRELPGGVEVLPAGAAEVAERVPRADLLVSTVLVVGDRPPLLVTRALLRAMRPGSVFVDVSIDQGGSGETSRPTTHSAPFFVEEGVVHYCVTNMPSAVPRTATAALSAVLLPYLLEMGEKGVEEAMRGNGALRGGLNCRRGKVASPGVARALGKEFFAPEVLLALPPAGAGAPPRPGGAG
jgi:alanine dehydrogenase